MKEVLRAYPDDVRFVFRHNPLPMHKTSRPAAEAFLAVHAMKGNAGAFALHDRLFSTDRCQRPMPDLTGLRAWLQALPRPAPTFDAATLEGHVRAIGLPVDRFRAEVGKTSHGTVVQAHQEQARKLGATGTPSIFVNGQFIRGLRSFGEMKALVDEQIVKVKKLMSDRRVPRAKVYETLIARGATAPVYRTSP